jgi:monovalent cation/proton antiporter MnhG/PhaG subunit
MSAQRLAVDVLVALAVGGELVCCLALVVFRNVFDRLHYAMAATTVPPFLVASAVLLEEGWNVSGVNALVTALALFLLNPVAAVAAGRAARLHTVGRVEPTAAERRH